MSTSNEYLLPQTTSNTPYNQQTTNCAENAKDATKTTLASQGMRTSNRLASFTATDHLSSVADPLPHVMEGKGSPINLAGTQSLGKTSRFPRALFSLVNTNQECNKIVKRLN